MSVYLFAHRETNHAAGRTCCPWNNTLSGCVLAAGPYRFSPDASHPRGMEGWKEDGWREGDGSSFGPFEEGRWALRGLDSCLSMELARLSLLNFTFSSSGFGLFLALFFLFSYSYGSNVPFIPSSSSSESRPQRVGVFLSFISVLEVQTKLLELGTSPTLCLHCWHWFDYELYTPASEWCLETTNNRTALSSTCSRLVGLACFTLKEQFTQKHSHYLLNPMPTESRVKFHRFVVNCSFDKHYLQTDWWWTFSLFYHAPKRCFRCLVYRRGIKRYKHTIGYG